MKTVKELSNDELIEYFEYEIKMHHYDPLCLHEEKYDFSSLKDEILDRLSS
jgi:hypothetical protein